VGRTDLKQRLETWLAGEDFEAACSRISDLPPRAALRELRRIAGRPEGLLRWRAVVAAGRVVARLAAEDAEAAREFIRRLRWGLNEEAGGIGWGLPEIFGEILAADGRLAAEYLPLYLSYLGPDDNFLEFPPLQQGLLWGLGRLVRSRAGLLDPQDLSRRVAPFLASPDPAVRGLAAWALSPLGPGTAVDSLRRLTDDVSPLTLFDGRRLIETTVADLARGALAGFPE
jgi:hypothetical protein